ncbi:auxin-responsive protein SAUR72-like [Dendrobium catenatum]|uniref:auxin-responsive protein SAUR72-like n=1 Tax=Dendrobium catenatum TaxID=906689 RepID=UPI0009F60A4A|nr:auxin-responsive protein SAUR72-like [Dendrobium catenatum]
MKTNHESLIISEPAAKRLTKAPKGYVPILVGDEGDEIEERFFVHIKMLRDPSIIDMGGSTHTLGWLDPPLIIELFEKAAEEFGYRQEGILRIPCGVEQFRRTVGERRRERY